MGRPDQKRNPDGTYANEGRKGLPSKTDIKPLYADDDDTVDRMHDAMNPNITALDMAEYAGDEDADVRTAAFNNPARLPLYRQTEETCNQLAEKKGRLTKADLAQLTPQAQECLKLQRKMARTNSAEYSDIHFELSHIARTERLNDDTFILLAKKYGEALADRDDIDARRAETLFRVSSPWNDPREEVVSRYLASNRNLHPSAWETVETHMKGTRSVCELVRNPEYPSDRVNRLAESWCSNVESIKDPYTQYYQPAVGKALLDRDDLTDGNRKRVMRANIAWAIFAERYNARNEPFANWRRHMGATTGDYDPDDPPEDM